ncbi:MAG: RsmD family RNA methyltransferase [Synergistaceae bacterium]|jgi:16S rRNA (guanine(966)-N(2))-methyltransferase RsmD|nr:RsmD family RNA methyltransferase [Synergistaceae bacterium]
MKEVRPTSGRVLLALFSILGSIRWEGADEPSDFPPGNCLEGRSFLDLFAGTGQVGLEALKRGVSSLVSVEVLKNRASEIERALSRRRAEDTIVLSLEFRRALAWLVRRGRAFDIVFADPPYGEGWGRSLLREKDLSRVLKQGGILIVEHSSREKLFVPSEEWTVTDSRVYGETTLTFLRQNGAFSMKPEPAQLEVLS